MGSIRIGKVSSVKGDKVQVVYPDKDAVSTFMPTLESVRGKLNIDDMVLTIHLDNGSVTAFCLGRFYNDNFSSQDSIIEQVGDKVIIKGSVEVLGNVSIGVNLSVLGNVDANGNISAGGNLKGANFP